MQKIGTIVILFILFTSCASTKKKMEKHIDKVIESVIFENQFTGILIVDAEKRDTLYNLNSTKYFTPASNTKIYTLFTSLNLLPDSLPALKYMLQNDTLFIEGTGYPALLHPYFKDSTSIQFLKGFDTIKLYLNNYREGRFGPGWSWGDYQWYYSPERSPFPLYGNVVTVYQKDSLKILPNFFKKSVVPLDYHKQREEYRNLFYFQPTRKDTVEIPFIIDTLLTRNLLEDALKKKVTLTAQMPQGQKQILYGIPSDSIYQKMMFESDNFLAEQLLILAASTLSDTLDTNKTREFVLDSLLPNLKHPPRWVDGSGLSRYNLFTPESMVHVLSKMYEEVPKERLFSLFPIGGVSGTLKNWYPGNPKPYIYAKTGSLGNNHCLSGYLISKTGRTFVFSFMNNHFRVPSSEIKKRMQQILETIRNNY